MVFSSNNRSAEDVSQAKHHPEPGFIPEPDWSTRQVAAVIGAVGVAAILPGCFSIQAWAQTMFPDVPSDYWAQPFIETLAQQGIVAGYPDGTFRPESTIDRDEYAAVLWRAFEADRERAIASGSTFTDVPEGYWAAPAIESAYEMGFLGTPDPNEFEPQTQVSRAEAISILVQGLDLADSSVVAAATTDESVAQTQTAQPQATQQRRGTPLHLAIPMASTELMKIFAPPPPAAVTSPQGVAATPDTALPQEDAAQPTFDLNQYYADADQIPANVQDEVALATRLGLVVNYPDVALLNPMAPLSRGSAAALVHQALVHQNRLEPLPDDSTAAPYVVEEGTAGGN